MPQKKVYMADVIRPISSLMVEHAPGHESPLRAPPGVCGVMLVFDDLDTLREYVGDEAQIRVAFVPEDWGR